MKKYNIKYFFIVFILFIYSLFNIGGSSFVINKEIDIKNISISNGDKAVCYYEKDNKTYKYTTIEKALEVCKNDTSENVIIVYPGIEYTITKECTLASNDYLIIPYSSVNNKNKLDEDVDKSGFADNDPTTFRKCLVKLANKLTIQSKGVLGICGQTGGTGPQGGTNGNYAELQFLSGGYIDCYGQIKCYGYIHDAIEKSRTEDEVAIYVYNGAEVGEPLAMYDWSSASDSLNKMKHVFPINLFDLPNIRPPMKFEYGSKLTAYGHIYGSSFFVGHRKANASIISKNNEEGFLQLQEGSEILLNFNSQTDLMSDKSYLKHSLTMRSSGNINLSAVVVSISGYELDSKKFFLPISGIYHLNVMTGKCIVKYRTKFLPGSNLEIGNGGEIQFLDNTTFYSSNVSDNGQTMPSYNFKTGANFVNNGQLVISKGFDGKILNNINDSTIETGGSYSEITDCYEANGSARIGPFIFGGGKVNLADNSEGTNASFRNIESSSRYRSNNGYYYKLADVVRSISITPNVGSSSAGASETYNLEANLSPQEGVNNIIYNWSCNGGYFNNSVGTTTATGKSITYTTPQNDSTSDDMIYTVECYATFVDENGQAHESNKGSATFTATKKDDGCITEDTLVMMANGTYKKAIDIRSGDLVMSLNHETGNIEPAPVVFNDHIDGKASNYKVISLEFSNGKKVEVVFEHGFFDLDTMQYEYINEDNYDKLIGHRFVTIDYIDGKAVKSSATLTKAYIEEKNIKICSPITYKNLNIVTENMLSIAGDIIGLFNIFEYNDNLAYDPVKKQNDIDNYGLLDYSYFNNSIPYEVYEAFNGQYLQVAMAKGILTEEMLNKYIEHYLPIISEQTNNR